MSVNYMLEIIGLDDWELTHPLPATAYKLMRKLQYLANKERFPERMNVSNGLLMSMVGCSEDSLIKARNQLIQAGLIQYKGQKKITPLYMIQYFSNNPAYNSKKTGYEQGIKRGYEQGIAPDYEQGTYINNTGSSYTDETWFSAYVSGDEDIPTTAEKIDKSSINARARDPLPTDSQRFDALFPKRENEWELEPRDRRYLSAARASLTINPHTRKLFAGREDTVRRIVDSSRFPPEMVCHAIDKTEIRNSRYPLDNPVQYMLTLLFDWEERGLATVQALQESKNDWTPA